MRAGSFGRTNSIKKFSKKSLFIHSNVSLTFPASLSHYAHLLACIVVVSYWICNNTIFRTNFELEKKIFLFSLVLLRFHTIFLLFFWKRECDFIFKFEKTRKKLIQLILWNPGMMWCVCKKMFYLLSLSFIFISLLTISEKNYCITMLNTGILPILHCWLPHLKFFYWTRKKI